ncbi:YchJ family protein [Ferribacterium limneticum]|uniref:YchJ family protein n=1 Tax=Ferribacterium limneticum TaxID=76259 RepID=UPI001CFA27DF|nr:YchJ family metal-binding protein [Ferribacterium limneticum]UCV28182.1 SEC-C domain-containing protein [Ferribacterium limneticum]UCV32099.1 SEC-C domain-containing protein [Ferribacterium limneticum]
MKTDDACPCGSGRRYADCCGRLHAGAEIARTAEALMRSRYSAYVLKLDDYLQASWHPSTRPVNLDLAEDDGTKWLGLEVKRHQQQDENNATVEFVARYRIDGRGHRLHEISRFVREDGRWFYVDGDIIA